MDGKCDIYITNKLIIVYTEIYQINEKFSYNMES